jgi:hypothetical protein
MSVLKGFEFGRTYYEMTTSMFNLAPEIARVICGYMVTNDDIRCRYTLLDAELIGAEHNRVDGQYRKLLDEEGCRIDEFHRTLGIH